MTAALPSLLVAILLPSLLGILMSKRLIGGGKSIFLYAGQGYLLGVLAVVWLIKIWDTAGWPLKFWPMVGVLFLLTVILWVNSHYRNAQKEIYSSFIVPRIWSNTPLRQRVTIILLCLAIAAHLTGIAQELLLRPTFPWDAWSSWQPEAIQFFDNRSLTATVQTNLNYGEVSSHAILWIMLASGETHQPYIHLPWLLAYTALGAVIFGHLCETHGATAAIIGSYLILSIPYLNIHTALAGYADLWLTLIFTIGIISLKNHLQTHRVGDFAITTLMVIACVQAKRAGIVLSLVLIAVVAIFYLMHGNRLAKLIWGFLCVFTIGTVMTVLSGHLSIELPLTSDHILVFSSSELQITDLLRFTFTPEWHHKPYLQALLTFSSWHLLFWFWLTAMSLLIGYRKWSILLSTENIAIICGLTIILTFFILAPRSALDHTRLSRVLLFLAPITVLLLISAVVHVFPQLRDREQSQTKVKQTTP